MIEEESKLMTIRRWSDALGEIWNIYSINIEQQEYDHVMVAADTVDDNGQSNQLS